MNDVIYWIWLAMKNGCGGTEALKLLRYFPGGAQEIYEASAEELRAARDCGDAFLRKLEDHSLTQAEEILEFCFTEGIRVISCASEEYPSRLHDLYNKPLVLYVRGRIEDLNERFCVSIVGTRDMSEYGKHMTFRLARQLLGYGAVIISGAAYGIDSSANNTAVFFETPTIAVLGSGVNVPYPPSNKDMLDRIAQLGMVVSEYPPNTPPNGRNFPVRNRIISGLCDALIVVEAGEKSGALITARHAADQHRMVYAVPGNVGAPNSVGTNNLIRDGAKLVGRCEDVLEDFIERFSLRQVEKIVNSDRYLRYEYNTRIPVAPENVPMPPSQQKKPPIRPAEHREPPAPVRAPEPVRAPAPMRRSEPEQPRVMNRETRGNLQITHTTMPLHGHASPVQEIPAQGKSAGERERVLSKLEPICTQVFNAMPDDEPVTTDQIVQAGIPANMVMSSLTLLELYAAVEAMPGGQYRKLI